MNSSVIVWYSQKCTKVADLRLKCVIVDRFSELICLFIFRTDLKEQTQGLHIAKFRLGGVQMNELTFCAMPHGIFGFTYICP